MNNNATHYNIGNVTQAKIIGEVSLQQIKSNVLDFLVVKQNIMASRSIIDANDLTVNLLRRIQNAF